ncbi:unnamed protein product [Closterium sp. Naga37s-1]|nr:unnamed protein product [Closterium sp. Naga37s-1]
MLQQFLPAASAAAAPPPDGRLAQGHGLAGWRGDVESPPCFPVLPPSPSPPLLLPYLPVFFTLLPPFLPAAPPFCLWFPPAGSAAAAPPRDCSLAQGHGQQHHHETAAWLKGMDRRLERVVKSALFLFLLAPPLLSPPFSLFLSSSPLLRLLQEHNREAAAWLKDMDRRLERDAAHLNTVLDRAIQQLSEERDRAEARATVIDQATAEAILRAPSVEAASAALRSMQATTVDLRKLAEGKGGERDKGREGANGEENGGERRDRKEGVEGERREEEKGPLVECLEMYTRAQGLEKRFHAALQVYQQYDREVAVRQFMLGHLKELDGYRSWTAAEGMDAAQPNAPTPSLFSFSPLHSPTTLSLSHQPCRSTNNTTGRWQ